MGGGLMQLVAYGAQDIYLTGNPQITFFKVVYRRHTNFAMESIEQVFNGVANFGNKVVCTIARNGDLVGRMYLEIDLSNDTLESDVSRLGFKLIKSAEVEIGGQRIDKHYGEWMDIWNQLSQPVNQLHKLNEMVNGALVQNGNRKLYIPLQFWFNTNPGLALPLIALQYHEVKVSIDFAKIGDIKGINSINNNDQLLNSSSFINCCLYCDYIFLDTDERRRFAQVSHEYLIHQVQYNGKSSYQVSETVGNIDLRFNHPCKEVVWSVQKSDLSCNKDGDNQPFNFNLDGNLSNNRGQDALRSAVIQLNGHDRFRERDSSYFRTVQPFQHHTGLFDNGQSDNKQKGMFYCYSFALKPEEHQPSGTCNFSRIDNAVLTLELNESDSGGIGKLVKVYATNYNVLRIMSGMGGLAYSN